MASQALPVRSVLTVVVAAILIAVAGQRADACGGFFCSNVPVNQNAEQIIFRQDGDQVVALVRIQYQGDAEDFSWVVPVPGIPEVTTSSELVFTSMDSLTRPRFRIQYEGQGCQTPFFDELGGVPQAAPSADGSAGGAVTILEEKLVGPFNVQIVNSDDPGAMAKWLRDNNYDLTERGEELIAPYVAEGMNFVALKLQKDKSVGDLVPLKMVYKTSRPMVPIRLTAVAAMPDMGIIVWLVGPARAIPTNFPHVVVNYAKINWLQQFGLYNSYRDLVTQAMNEAGGLGFATDFAGPGAELSDMMPEVETLRTTLNEQAGQLDPAQGLVGIARTAIFPQSNLSSLFAEHLPLPEGEPLFAYGNAQRLAELFSFVQLRLALDAIVADIRSEIIDPYEDGLRVLDGEPYVTRMFTTLSPDEMTLDPCFGYNSDLEDQPVERVAILHRECIFDELHWTLTLGAGTDRDGEVIDSGVGDIMPVVSEANAKQSSFRDMRFIPENVDPMVVPTGSTPYVNRENLCGIFNIPLLALNLLGISALARRRRHPSG